MTIFTAKSFVATANTFQEYKRNLKNVRTKSPDIFRLSTQLNTEHMTTCRFGHPVRRKSHQRQRRHQQGPYPMRSVPVAEKSLLREGLAAVPESVQSPE